MDIAQLLYGVPRSSICPIDELLVSEEGKCRKSRSVHSRVAKGIIVSLCVRDEVLG